MTAVIGGGGKTSLLYVLSEELKENGTVLLCTSTHIRVPEQYPLVTGGAEEILSAFGKYRIVCAGTPAVDNKLTAPPVSFAELGSLADHVLVEADGSRGLPLKAHAPHEPVIPDDSDRVILVLGADGFGKPVRDVCHRPEIWARLAGTAPDRIATPEGEARVIISEGLSDMVFINKAESAEECAYGEELAALIPQKAVIGSLNKGMYRLCQ